MAGAALAFSLATSQAQVYSANVVGYCNVVIPAGPSYTFLASPFDNGNGNSATNWLDPNNTLPNKTAISVWNGATFNSIVKGGGIWPAAAATTTIPPGQAFFVIFPPTQTTPLTNTFVGTVIVNSGGSITNVIPPGYSAWGSPIPYAGDLVTDPNLNVGHLLIVNKSAILTWNGTTYNNDTLGGGIWPTSAPLSVGSAFFLIQKGVNPTNWVETATY